MAKFTMFKYQNVFKADFDIPDCQNEETGLSVYQERDNNGYRYFLYLSQYGVTYLRRHLFRLSGSSLDRVYVSLGDVCISLLSGLVFGAMFLDKLQYANRVYIQSTLWNLRDTKLKDYGRYAPRDLQFSNKIKAQMISREAIAPNLSDWSHISNFVITFLISVLHRYGAKHNIRATADSIYTDVLSRLEVSYVPDLRLGSKSDQVGNSA
jgi:hypothetical protein